MQHETQLSILRAQATQAASLCTLARLHAAIEGSADPIARAALVERRDALAQRLTASLEATAALQGLTQGVGGAGIPAPGPSTAREVSRRTGRD
ncbi:MAG: hypothetical protein LDL44_00240 [Caenispirillum sp.]|nr:hypothetical protein [Caenispirillum sp.]